MCAPGPTRRSCLTCHTTSSFWSPRHARKATQVCVRVSFALKLCVWSTFPRSFFTPPLPSSLAGGLSCTIRSTGALHAQQEALLQLSVLCWQLQEMLEREWCSTRTHIPTRTVHTCTHAGARVAPLLGPRPPPPSTHPSPLAHRPSLPSPRAAAVAASGVGAARKEWGSAQAEVAKRMRQMASTLEDHDPEATDAAGELACMLAAGEMWCWSNVDGGGGGGGGDNKR